MSKGPCKQAWNASRSPAYRSWASMKTRCNNPNYRRYDIYGGRGIKVCARWADFAAFLADMGPRPPGTSLDRIDGNGDYEPGNCRWATTKVQCRNTAAVRLTEEAAMQIRWLCTDGGYAQSRVASAFKVSRAAVNHVVARRTWV